MAIITVSGGIYSGGKELAECLSEKLSYRLVSQEHLLPIEQVGRLEVPGDEPETALVEKFGLLDGSNLRRILYNAYMQVAICEDARTDNVIYHGQAANLLLRGIPHHFGIRVIADIDYRIQAAMKYKFLNYDKASKLIASRDTEINEWIKGLYNADRNDPLYYDLVVNAATINMSDACSMITRTVETQIETKPESLKAIDDQILAAEIRAKVALERVIDSESIQIEVDDGTVTIRGTVRSSDDADRIRSLVLRHPGVKDIRSQTAVRW